MNRKGMELVSELADHLSKNAGQNRSKIKSSAMRALELLSLAHSKSIEDGEVRLVRVKCTPDGTITTYLPRHDFETYATSLPKKQRDTFEVFLSIWSKKLRLLRSNVQKGEHKKFICPADLLDSLEVAKSSRMCVYCGRQFKYLDHQKQRLFCPQSEDMRSDCNDRFHSWLGSIYKRELAMVGDREEKISRRGIKLTGLTVGQSKKLKVKQVEAMIKRYQKISQTVNESLSSSIRKSR